MDRTTVTFGRRRRGASVWVCLLGIVCVATGCFDWHDPVVPLDAAVPATLVDAGVDPSLCEAQDVTRTDAWMTCTSDAPFYWTGTVCKWIGDCACSGASCGAGWATFDDCMGAHDGCFGTGRGCSTPSDCATDEYCRSASSGCGAPGVCRPRPREPLDCGFARETICACSSHYFGNRCRSHLLGEDAAPCG